MHSLILTNEDLLAKVKRVGHAKRYTNEEKVRPGTQERVDGDYFAWGNRLRLAARGASRSISNPYSAEPPPPQAKQTPLL